MARGSRAPEQRASHTAQSPAEQNGRGLKHGSARPLRPLGPGVTTIAVRNIPARYMKDELLKEWPPDGAVDLLYRPYDFQGKTVFGHAFVNFTSNAAAIAFQLKWHGKFFSHQRKGRALDIVGATTQGYKENLERALCNLNAHVDGDQCLLAVFRGTVRLDAHEEAARLGVSVPRQQEWSRSSGSSAELQGQHGRWQ